MSCFYFSLFFFFLRILLPSLPKKKKITKVAKRTGRPHAPRSHDFTKSMTGVALLPIPIRRQKVAVLPSLLILPLLLTHLSTAIYHYFACIHLGFGWFADD